jgi:hypothetical protein
LNLLWAPCTLWFYFYLKMNRNINDDTASNISSQVWCCTKFITWRGSCVRTRKRTIHAHSYSCFVSYCVCRVPTVQK